MEDTNEISYIRVDILENWRFWNRYRSNGDFEGAGKEVIAEADALLALNASGNKRVETMIEESRIYREKKQRAGQKGGKSKAANKSQNVHGGNEAENPGAADGGKKIASREKEGSEIPPSGGGATHLSGKIGEHPDAHEVESASGCSGILGQEQRPSDADAGMDCETSASENFGGAAVPERDDGSSPPLPLPTGSRRPPIPSDPQQIPELDDVYDFARLTGLDDLIAREWYEMTSNRKWMTRDGEIIHNWKGTLTKYVRSRIRKLEQQ